MLNLLLSRVIDLAKKRVVSNGQECTFNLDELNKAPNQLARLGSWRITKLNYSLN